MNKEFDVLLRLVSNSLFDSNYEILDEVDWEKVFKESINQAVAAIAFDGLKNTKVPDEIKNQWLMFYAKTVKNNYDVNNQHFILHKLMVENNVPYCVLKGSASAYFYPNPKIRSMGDVDFLVPHESYKKAIDVFLRDGFVTRGERDDVHTVFRKEKMHFEMHFEPPGIPNGNLKKTIEKCFENLIDTSEIKDMLGNQFVCPSLFHHGLILLLHTAHHMLREGIGLRHLCDWAVFFNRFEYNEFKNLFEKELKEIGLWDFANILALLSAKYLGMPITEDIKTEFSKFDCLMEDIFIAGNFGKKAQSRYFESLYIASETQAVQSKSKFGRFATKINDILYKKHKWLKKAPYLLPLFWIVYGSKYCVRMIFGKRKVLISNDIMNAAEKRNDIYMGFNLFNTNK